MGFVADAVKGLTGSGAKAAKEASKRQIAGQEAGIEELKAASNFGISKLEPFREAGQTDIGGLGDLVTNPQRQLEFIQNNPFFEALAQRSQENILGGAASKGKTFAGGTAEALQNSLLLLGTDLVNQNITQRSNLAHLGLNAARSEADIKLRGAGGVAGLQSDIGATGAAGVLGARKAQTDAFETVLSLGTTAATGGFSTSGKKAFGSRNK